MDMSNIYIKHECQEAKDLPVNAVKGTPDMHDADLRWPLYCTEFLEAKPSFLARLALSCVSEHVHQQYLSSLSSAAFQPKRSLAARRAALPSADGQKVMRGKMYS